MVFKVGNKLFTTVFANNGLKTKLYEECDKREVPRKLREEAEERIKKHLGCGIGMIEDGYFFSNTANETLHKYFKEIQEPIYKLKLENLSFEEVRKFINNHKLEVKCKLKEVYDEKVCGKIFVEINTDFSKKGNLFETIYETGIQEIDEYFFRTRRENWKLDLDFEVDVPKDWSIEEEYLENFKKHILTLYNKNEMDIFGLCDGGRHRNTQWSNTFRIN